MFLLNRKAILRLARFVGLVAIAAVTGTLAANELGKTLVALQNAAADKAAVLRFNVKQLPCFTQWKNTVGRSDGFVTGIEPGTNFPNLKSGERERGRVIKLDPGASWTVDLDIEIQDKPSGVKAIQAEIAALQSRNGTAVVHKKPHPKFS